MKKLIIQNKVAESILEKITIKPRKEAETDDSMLALRKAMGHKYIRKWQKNGKWQYLYPGDFLQPFKAVKRLYGIEGKKVTAIYEAHNIENDYGADKKTFTSHILEYLSDRSKWNKIFSVKENRAKYDKPVKQKDVAAAAAVKKLNDDEPPSLFPANIINRSLMKKVWDIYNSQKNPDTAAESGE